MFLNNVERVPHCKTKFVFTMLTRKIRLLRRISKAVEAEIAGTESLIHAIL